MPSRPPLSKQQWKREEFDQHHMSQGQSHAQQALVLPLLHPDEALRRQMLASELSIYVREIRSFENGYGFRFDRSDDLEVLEDLLTKIAKYIVCESLNSSRPIFTIDEEPKGTGFWLQIRSVEGDVPDIALASVPSYSFGSL